MGREITSRSFCNVSGRPTMTMKIRRHLIVICYHKASSNVDNSHYVKLIHSVIEASRTHLQLASIADYIDFLIITSQLITEKLSTTCRSILKRRLHFNISWESLCFALISFSLESLTCYFIYTYFFQTRRSLNNDPRVEMRCICAWENRF